MKDYISAIDIRRRIADAYLWVLVANPTWIVGHVASCILSRDKGAIYATIEGIPYPDIAKCFNLTEARYVANSHFTRDCLVKVGWNVIDVVHHAYDQDEVTHAKPMAQRYRAKMEKDFPGRVKFTYVGRDDHRKQLDRLMKAIDILNEKVPDKYVLFMHTDTKRAKEFEKPNVYITGQFGTASHIEVLALMGACDFYITPSVSEGFGVPVLESIAMGRPVVCNRMPPLTEFTDEKVAIYFDYDYEEFWKTTADQYFHMHMYSPEALADAMLRAIDIYMNNRSLYEDMCKTATTHVKPWECRTVYKKFFKVFGWE
jgi:glycosyltransferase involved in cell wall biosynthesis